MYVQDTITKSNGLSILAFVAICITGCRWHDRRNRVSGVAYNVPKTNTMLRASYARALETPFNENLVLSSTGCNFPVIAAMVPCVPSPLTAGYRNEFHAGLQQAFGKIPCVQASTSGSTLITRTTSATSGTLRSSSRSGGTTRRFRDGQFARACRTTTVSVRWW